MSEVIDDKNAETELNIAFLICDEPKEETLKKHGGFDDMVLSISTLLPSVLR